MFCRIAFTALVFFQSIWLSAYCGAQKARPNVLLICVDDLRPELACYGVDYIHSPNIDSIAARGRLFRHHYVQAPTCGASRYTLLTGRYGGSGNGALFQRAELLKKAPASVTPSMPAWFREQGYTAVSVGKVSHHPGGLGGNRWKDPGVLEMPNSWDRHLLPAGDWKDPQGWMHGLAHGEIRVDARKRGGTVEMDVFQSAEGGDSIYPDGISIEESLRQIDLLTSDNAKPFFLAVGILRPHLPFGAPAKYLNHYKNIDLPPTPHPTKPVGKTTWHRSGEFMKYDRFGKDPNTDAEFAIDVRKHYAACVSYADAQVGRLLARLKKTGQDENTIVVLWGDHGWHLGEHAIWGKHALFEESLRSPLIIAYPGIEQPGDDANGIVETLDIFPTLCELANMPIPENLDGRSLTPILENPNESGHFAVSYTGKNKTIRTESHRLVLHQNGFAELYDHSSIEQETRNIASEASDLVDQLKRRLKARLP